MEARTPDESLGTPAAVLWTTAIAHLHECVLLLDGDLRVLELNASARARFPDLAVGSALAPLIGGDPAFVLAQDGDPSLRKGRLRIGGESWDLRLVRLQQAAGAVRHLLLALPSATGDLAERERVLAQRELECDGLRDAASLAKDEFLATVSHELRTPLNAIVGWAHMLRSGGLDAAGVSRAVEAIERNARTQREVVDALIDASVAFQGRLKVHPEPVDLRDAVRQAGAVLGPLATARGITLALPAAGEPVLVAADPGRLAQLTAHVLANALKFTPRAGSVTASVEAEGSGATLTVKDTGIGVPDGLQELLFDPFRQADASSTRRHGGLGLGLTLVRHLVVLHGGTIDVESAGAGGGATVRIRLPPPAAIPTPGRAAVGPPALVLRGLRVSVSATGETGVRICSALVAAGAQIADEQPEVTIVDADVGDVEVLGETAIALGATPVTRAAALQAGARLVLPKPVDTVEVLTAVASVSDRLP